MQLLINQLRDLHIHMRIDEGELKVSGATEVIENEVLVNEIRAHREQLKMFVCRFTDPLPFHNWFMTLPTRKCTECKRFERVVIGYKRSIRLNKCSIYSRLECPEKPCRCIWYK